MIKKEDGEGWIHPAQDMDMYSVVENMVMKVRVSYNAGNFSTS
jgi:hypothetical protein